jgi:hypothetical protein
MNLHCSSPVNQSETDLGIVNESQLPRSGMTPRNHCNAAAQQIYSCSRSRPSGDDSVATCLGKCRRMVRTDRYQRPLVARQVRLQWPRDWRRPLRARPGSESPRAGEVSFAKGEASLRTASAPGAAFFVAVTAAAASVCSCWT